jgi:selenocysteine lyase/cysteine desulfurase
MPAVCQGLSWLQRIGMCRVERHVGALTDGLLDRLGALGERVTTYGPRCRASRGGTVAFNVRRPGGDVPYETIEAAARHRGIAIRGGCFCNPGAAEYAFELPRRQVRACVRGEFSIPSFRRCLGGRPVGALRASIGVPTTEGDLDRLANFLTDVAART